MYKYQDRVFSTAGQPIQGVLVTVYATGTQTLAALYSDNGSTVTSNPVSTDSDGHFEFYVANGRYDIAFSGSAIAAPLVLTDVDVADPTGYVSASADNTWTGSNTFSGTNLFTKRITVQTTDADSVYVKPTADVDAVVVTPDADSETSVGFGITNAANNAWTFRARKNGNIDATGTLTLPNVQATTLLMSPRINNIRYADQFSGATADAKINAAIADLPSGGGVVDCRGFGATAQTIAATVEIGSNSAPGKTVTLLIDRTTTYTATITNGSPAWILDGGSSIIGCGTVPLPNAGLTVASTANVSNILLFRNNLAANLAGGMVEGLFLYADPAATISDAIFGVQNCLQISQISEVTVAGFGIQNTVGLKIYSTVGASNISGNIQFNNIQIDMDGASGSRPVWIGCAASASLTPVSAGGVNTISFLGCSALTHPGAGLPIVTIEASDGAGGHNVVGNINFFGTQVESDSATDIGILVNGAESVHVYGLYASARTAAGGDIIKLAQPAGTTLDGIDIRGVDNQAIWTNTLNDTISSQTYTGVLYPRLNYSYSASGHHQDVIAPGLIIVGTAPTVSTGQIAIGSTTATTVGAAGGASALPATPVGYLIVNIAGTARKIPYFTT
jgi:hypothetical protein